MILEVLLAVGVGFASALLPVVNAEAFQAGASLVQPPRTVMACVLALSVGQTGGKVVIFTASRRGAVRWRSTQAGRAARRARRPSGRAARAWVTRTNARVLQWLSHPLGGPAAVVVSACIGMPPLAVISAAAGLSTIRSSTFAIACLAGRLARFAALAGLLAAVTC